MTPTFHRLCDRDWSVGLGMVNPRTLVSPRYVIGYSYVSIGKPLGFNSVLIHNSFPLRIVLICLGDRVSHVLSVDLCRLLNFPIRALIFSIPL